MIFASAAKTAASSSTDDVALVSNPEFLREGPAVNDFLHADRVVVGGTDPEACQTVPDLYGQLDTKFIVCDPYRPS